MNRKTNYWFGKKKSEMRFRFSCFMLVLTLAVLFSSAAPARAASAATVIVEPVEVMTTVGAEIEIRILVIGGVDVNAYDLTLTYNPDILTLDSWEHGDYLSNHWVVQNIDDPGIFQLADAQLGLPPVSGDGTLLVLTFLTIGEGESDLTLEEVTFADAEGTKSYPVMEDGRVIASKSEGSPPTLTLTPTPTRTPTPTKTLSSVTQAPTTTPLITATSTAEDLGGQLDAPRSGNPPAETEAAGDPTDEGAYPSAAGEVESTQTAGAAMGGQDNAQDGPSAGDGEQSGSTNQSISEPLQGLGVLLWVVLISAVLALVVMFIIVIRRQRNKPEDLLI